MKHFATTAISPPRAPHRHCADVTRRHKPRGGQELGEQRRCDLIVVAHEGQGAVMRLLSGSIVPGLITASSVPVMVCKANGAALKKVRPRALARRPAGSPRAENGQSPIQ